ncbi:MAG: hypothetical protein AAF585_03825 [Verrucomicrobiota bacterium]
MIRRIQYYLAVCILVPLGLVAQSISDDDDIPMLKSLLLRDAPVHYVAWLIGDTWEKPIVVNQGARDKEISIFLDDINCLNALKAVCHSNGLWFQEDPDSGIIYIETLEEYIQGSRLNNQKQVEVVTVVYPRAEDIAASLQELFQDMIVYVEPEYENGDDIDDIERAIERMSQLSTLSTLVDEGNTTGGGGRSSSSRSSGRGQNQDGIDATARFLDEIANLEEDQPNQIEANESGEPVRLNPGLVYLAAVRQSNTLLLRSSDPDAIKQIKEVIDELDRPRAQVLLEVKVLALDVSDEKQRAVDILFNSAEGDVSAGFGSGLADVPRSTSSADPSAALDPITGLPVAPILNELGELGLTASGFDSRSVVFQVIGEEVQARIRMLDNEGKIERLATPNLMVADLEASRIFVGEETTILTDVEVEVTPGTTQGTLPTTTRDPETERRDIGTTLVITPKIHADNTVTIRIMQENARVGLTKTVVYGNVAAGDFFETTDIQKQTISSTVVAKSGEMVALGGLINRSKISNVTSIPVLSDVPLIGPLFEQNVSNDINSELIVLIRPFVMLTPATAERLSQGYVNRNVTHPAATDGTLNQGMDNPIREENRKKRSQELQERIEVKSTPLDF